ncbi:MAG: LysR substrate-binding domain-containing protein [Ostreibacterium sp.]
MTITELKYIVALAKMQHFGRAAQSMFVSQPTLSIGIKKLEDELDIKIFERLSNKAIPTQAGQRIIETSRNILMNTDIIRAIAAETKEGVAGDVKLGAIYTICPYLLPKMVPDLQQYSPDIKLYIEENHTNELISQLKDGSLDIALLSLPITESSLFEVKPIFEEDFYVMMPKGHPLEDEESIQISQLDNESIFLLGNGNCFRDQVLQACPNCLPSAEHNSTSAILAKNTLVQGGSLATIQMMVGGGLGLSIFPKMAIAENPAISVRAFAEPTPKRQIALVWRKSFTRIKIIQAIEASLLRCHQRLSHI